MLASLHILDNVPEIEAERTSEDVRLENLVDQLPFLKEGHWSGVDVDQFIRRRQKTAKEPVMGLMGGRASHSQPDRRRPSHHP